MPAPMPQQAATASMLNTAEPTMVPTPMSPSVMNVPITLTNSSGADVAAAMNVAPATSFDILSADGNQSIIIRFNEAAQWDNVVLLITCTYFLNSWHKVLITYYC